MAVSKEELGLVLSEVDVRGVGKERRSAYLLPLLQRVQRQFGYLPPEAVPEIAEQVGVSEARVLGVATFYSQFRFAPAARNSITVCCGTACHVRGSARLLDDLRKRLGIDSGETTPDLSFSLNTIACFGSCALAPVVVINEKVHGRMKRATLLKKMGELAPEEGEEAEQ